MGAAEPQSAWQFDVPSMLEAIDSAVLLFDRQGKLTFLNREAMRLFGFQSFAEAADHAEGRTHVPRLATFAGVPLEGPSELIRRALAGERVGEDFERIAPQDGEPQMVLRTSVCPLVDENGVIVGALKLAHEVTKEYELARCKEEFVRVTSHELRTPTTSLRLNAQRLLGMDRPSLDGVRKSAEAIVGATRRIETMAVKIDDIVSIAAGERIVLEPTELRLDALVEDVARSVDDSEASRVHLRTTPATVRADPMRVRQAVEGLLDNALRYSVAPAPVQVDVATHDGLAEVSITDHGIGIPRAKQPHVFEQFYRGHVGTPFDRGGLGVSLYLAAQIMKQHGGRISFESTETRGSTFHLAFDAIDSTTRT